MALNIVKNIHKLQNDIFLELDSLTLKKFTNNVCKFVNLICDMEYKSVIKFLVILRHANKLLVTHPRRAKIYKKIVRLICSKNNIDNADSQPIGQDLSIDMYAKIAQDLLNVKRFTDKKTIKQNDTIIVNDVEAYLVKNKLHTERIVPELNFIIIHTQTNNKCWFRLKVKWIDKLKNIQSIVKHPKLSIRLEGIAFLTDDIIEIIYNSFNVKLIDYMEILSNEFDFVEHIIFFSNLRLFKSKCSCPITKFSNILKFYYCNVTKSSDFIITNVNNIDLFNRLYLNSFLLLNKDNLSVSSDNFSPNPIACLAGTGPIRTVRSKAMKVETLTEYDLLYTQKKTDEDNDVDLRGSALSRESYAIDCRHIIHKVIQDREVRILEGYSTIGGCNPHELILTLPDIEENED
ncbi:p47 [Dikerogammarus haemobaphes nudivirus]|nr:p47 [Dikerogammarus haemobaphes nudivirus]